MTVADEPNEAQIDLLEDLLAGRACMECGEPIEPGRSCECCAEKRAILREVFPELYGDS